MDSKVMESTEMHQYVRTDFTNKNDMITGKGKSIKL